MITICKHDGCNAHVMPGRGYCGRHGGIKRHRKEQAQARNDARRREREQRKQKKTAERQKRQAARAAVSARELKHQVRKGQRQASSNAGGAPMTGLRALARMDWLKRQAANAPAPA